jgi:hypothetical protein
VRQRVGIRRLCCASVSLTLALSQVAQRKKEILLDTQSGIASGLTQLITKSKSANFTNRLGIGKCRSVPKPVRLGDPVQGLTFVEFGRHAYGESLIRSLHLRAGGFVVRGEYGSVLVISPPAMSCQARRRCSGFRVQGSESRINAKPETSNLKLLSVAKKHSALDMPNWPVRARDLDSRVRGNDDNRLPVLSEIPFPR